MTMSSNVGPPGRGHVNPSQPGSRADYDATDPEEAHRPPILTLAAEMLPPGCTSSVMILGQSRYGWSIRSVGSELFRSLLPYVTCTPSGPPPIRYLPDLFSEARPVFSCSDALTTPPNGAWRLSVGA